MATNCAVPMPGEATGCPGAALGRCVGCGGEFCLEHADRLTLVAKRGGPSMTEYSSNVCVSCGADARRGTPRLQAARPPRIRI
jgi:hypothetical protein